jgi:RND superfamily putative drug exporter
MARIARWSIAHRWLVVAGWVLLAVVGGLTVARSGSRLSFTFDLPGQPAYQTNTAIAHTFGSGGNEPPLVAVVRLPQGVTVQSPGVREQLTRAFGKAAAALPGARTASWVSTGDRAFVSADGRTTFELIYPVASLTSSDPYATALPRLDKALAGQQVHGAPVRVTGATILSSGGQGGGNSVLAETLRCGAGGIRSRFSTRRTVEAPTRRPRPSSSPWIRWYPQPGFSRAICSISAASRGSTGGLPPR